MEARGHNWAWMAFGINVISYKNRNPPKMSFESEVGQRNDGGSKTCSSNAWEPLRQSGPHIPDSLQLPRLL